MKIFYVCDGIPFRRHGQPGVTAVHIVTYELLNAIANVGQEIILQPLFTKDPPIPTPAENEELQFLTSLGIRVMSPISTKRPVAPHRPSSITTLASALWNVSPASKLDHYYPALAAGAVMSARVNSTSPDSILTVWSPDGVAATHACRRLVPRVAYQGDIDFMPALARSKDSWLYPSARGRVPGARRIIERLGVVRFRQMHVRLMKGVQVVANVTASNADFYARQGHRGSVYVGNTWSCPPTASGTGNSVGKPTGRPIKIIGHVGYLDRTGSTFGLRFLLLDVLPELEKVLEGLNYQVHIIGGGQMVPALRPLANRPHVVLRGYVEDLDKELESSDMVLVLNNAGPFRAAFTRHIVAWSMGLCLVAHSNSREAIPEMVHAENCMLGANGREVAQAMFQAATDAALNTRVREGGRLTYKKHFTPAAVTKRLLERMEANLDNARRRPSP